MRRSISLALVSFSFFAPAAFATPDVCAKVLLGQGLQGHPGTIRAGATGELFIPSGSKFPFRNTPLPLVGNFAVGSRWMAVWEKQTLHVYPNQFLPKAQPEASLTFPRRIHRVVFGANDRIYVGVGPEVRVCYMVPKNIVCFDDPIPGPTSNVVDIESFDAWHVDESNSPGYDILAVLALGMLKLWHVDDNAVPTSMGTAPYPASPVYNRRVAVLPLPTMKDGEIVQKTFAAVAATGAKVSVFIPDGNILPERRFLILGGALTLPNSIVHLRGLISSDPDGAPISLLGYSTPFHFGVLEVGFRPMNNLSLDVTVAAETLVTSSIEGVGWKDNIDPQFTASAILYGSKGETTRANFIHHSVGRSSSVLTVEKPVPYFP